MTRLSSASEELELLHRGLEWIDCKWLMIRGSCKYFPWPTAVNGGDRGLLDVGCMAFGDIGAV
eukprot:scaffold218112_cov79-Cyclotella_meneghiniana.AAC.2